MKRILVLVMGVLGALGGTVGCKPDAVAVVEAGVDGGPPIASWCGEPDDLPCCEGSPSAEPPVSAPMPYVAPLFEPVLAADDATRAFVEAGGLDVPAVWRGVTESSDPERPSRVTLEVPSVGTLTFNFARAVDAFPSLPDGTTLTLSIAPPASPYPSDYNRGRAVRVARTDGSLIAVAGVGCDWDGGPPLPALFAPFSGVTASASCREAEPVFSPGHGWCYVGRTNYALALDGVPAPIAPGETAQVTLGGVLYDFTNYRFAFQDNGGPHVGGTCAPAIASLCSFSAFPAP